MGTPVAARLIAAGFTHVYDLGGLQYITDMQTETGPWDGVLPTCAEDESDHTCLFWILLFIAFFVGCLCAILFVCKGFLWYRHYVQRPETLVVPAVAADKLSDPWQTPAAAPVQAVPLEALKEDSAAIVVVQDMQQPLPPAYPAE